MFCFLLFPQFDCACAILAVCYSPNLTLCYTCCVIFPQFWLPAIFAVCYIAACYFPHIGSVPYLLFAIPSIWAVCDIRCVLFPQFGCVLYLLCATVFPQFFQRALFAVCYSINVGWVFIGYVLFLQLVCVSYLLCSLSG
jgi:hypothetical protein